jgi:hypothetical protein
MPDHLLPHREAAALARTAARQARGASTTSLITAMIARAIYAKTGKPVRRADVTAFMQGHRKSISGCLSQAATAGYLTAVERGRYTPGPREPDPAMVTNQRRREAKEVLRAVEDAYSQSPRALVDAVIEVLKTEDSPPLPSRDVSALRKALAPFARLGKRLAEIGAPPESIPTLLRRDGIEAKDFIAATEAFAALKPPKAAAHSDEDKGDPLAEYFV